MDLCVCQAKRVPCCQGDWVSLLVQVQYSTPNRVPCLSMQMSILVCLGKMAFLVSLSVKLGPGFLVCQGNRDYFSVKAK